MFCKNSAESEDKEYCRVADGRLTVRRPRETVPKSLRGATDFADMLAALMQHQLDQNSIALNRSSVG